MTYFVKRTSRQNAAGISYVGPLPGSRADLEADAWRTAGETAEVLEATEDLQREVRRWDKVTHAADARELVTYRGEQMTMSAYRLLHAV